jgi:hypothetical protein
LHRRDGGLFFFILRLGGRANEERRADRGRDHGSGAEVPLTPWYERSHDPCEFSYDIERRAFRTGSIIMARSSRISRMRRVNAMKYLHTMVRVTDLAASLRFYCDALGLRKSGAGRNEKGRFTLVFLAAPGDDEAPSGAHL